MAWNEPGGNNNDPWGNNNRGGGNQGPPDLDEAFKKMMDKLGGLFGGNGGGNKDNQQTGGGFGIVIIALAVILAFQSVYTLDESERGVVLRLGKYERTETPGLKFKFPLIETVTPVNVTQIQEADIRDEMLTEDENVVEVAINVQYRVTDPVNFALRIEDPRATLDHAAESALRHEVGSTELDPILTQGRVELAENTRARLQEYLDRYQTGISVSSMNVKEARAPGAVQEAFDDVQKAKLDKERYVNEAESYANSIVPEARGKAQRMLEEANAYKEQVIAQAEGEADRFEALLKEYKKAPRVTRERLYIDAIQKVYANSNKVLVDVEGGNNMMYLPLDKIMSNTQTAPATGTSTRSSSGLDSNEIERITDQVITEIRNRQRNN